jgi:hypothetical protein
MLLEQGLEAKSWRGNMQHGRLIQWFGGKSILAAAPGGLSMLDQWEYKLLVAEGLPATFRDREGRDYGHRLDQELLNRLGKEGWEVCAYNLSSVSSGVLILKRKVTSA